VKKAGPCRGISRASSHALAFSGAHAIAGGILIIVVGMFTGPSEYGDFTGIILVAHFISVVAVWPGAVVMNLVLLRLFRPRSWRRAYWRAWAAGIAALPLIWVGLMVSSHFVGRSSSVVMKLFGNWEPYFSFLGVAILCANLSIVLAWAVPPWSKSKPRAQDTVPKPK